MPVLPPTSSTPHFSGMDLTYAPHWDSLQIHLMEAGAQAKSTAKGYTPPADDEVRLNGKHLGNSEDVLALSQRLANGEEIPEDELRTTLSNVILERTNTYDADPEKCFAPSPLDIDARRPVSVKELFEEARNFFLLTLSATFGQYTGHESDRDQRNKYKTRSFTSSPSIIQEKAFNSRATH